MKKIVFLFVSAVVLCSSFVLATNSQESTSVNSESSFLKCEFTLDHYTGTLSDGDYPRTRDITVQLNCPQDEDISVNVYVWVGDERVASEVFTICAGKKRSSSGYIIVPKEYKGMKYKLTVN